MDVDALVMTAAVHLGVHADSADTFAGPVAGIQITVIGFADPAQAARFADACMVDGVPAMAHDKTVAILH